MNSDELKHLQPSCRSAALLTNDERIHWLRQERWIQYPRAQRVLDRLMELVDYPPRDRMPALVIYGATGMGKTPIIQKFLRDHRAHFDKKIGRTRLPVISIQMPPSPSERDFYEEILAAMGGIFAYGTMSQPCVIAFEYWQDSLKFACLSSMKFILCLLGASVSNEFS